MADQDITGTGLKPLDGHDSTSVQLVAEELTLSKRSVAAGSVRVSTKTHTHEEMAEITLDRAGVEVTRVPINRVVDAPPPVRHDGDTMIVPVIEERLVVTKQLYLVEEVHIHQRLAQETVRTSVPLRRQHVVIERTDDDGRPVPPETSAERPPRQPLTET